MTRLTDIWRQLIERRLWPVALLLIVALVAVPILLARDEAVPPASPTDTSRETGLPEDLVTLAENQGPAQPTERRRVLGKSKNPFAPSPGAVVPDAVVPTVTPTASGSPDAGAGGDTGSPGGGTGATTSPAPTTPTTPTPTPTPRHARELHELTVRFGETTGELEKLVVAPRKPLPPAAAADAPLAALIYLGVADDGKSAEFLLEVGVTAQGDGVCAPDPSNCQRILLREGETEFFDVVRDGGAEVQYQLDLVDIYNLRIAAKATNRQGSVTSSTSAIGSR